MTPAGSSLGEDRAKPVVREKPSSVDYAFELHRLDSYAGNRNRAPKGIGASGSRMDSNSLISFSR